METMSSPIDPLTWLRSRCESLPAVEEVIAWGHPNFRVAGRAFAVFELYRGRPCIAVKAEREEQDLLIERFGFFKTPYVWKQGWVSTWVDVPFPLDLLEGLLKKAHFATSRMPPRQPRGPRSPPKPRNAARNLPIRPKHVP